MLESLVSLWSSTSGAHFYLFFIFFVLFCISKLTRIRFMDGQTFIKRRPPNFIPADIIPKGYDLPDQWINILEQEKSNFAMIFSFEHVSCCVNLKKWLLKIHQVLSGLVGYHFNNCQRQIIAGAAFAICINIRREKISPATI